MKFLLHSNAPTVKTGYGVQTALLADRLTLAGHEVAISATFGHAPGTGMGSWTTPHGHKVPVFPHFAQVSGSDVIVAHARHFFGNDEGWIIPLLDVWSLAEPELADLNVAAWAPVDHDPVPPIVTRFFDRTPGARCIAMSRHGQAEFLAAGIDAAYIPLAVDTKVYRPTYSVTVNGREVSAREYFDLPESAFVVGMVGMNKDPNDRKAMQEAFAAFALFAKDHPNAMLHVHSEPQGLAGGLNLPELAKAVGIHASRLKFTAEYAYLYGFEPEQMALMYTAFDVLLAPSVGEGFCVPLIEAQACGVPVIASDFTAQPELVGQGWQVTGQRWWDAASHSWYQRPNIASIVEALEQAYAAELANMQDACRQFAMQYDADYVFDTYWKPYLLTLDSTPPADKPPMVSVAVLVPALNRPANVPRLVDSFNATNDGTARLFYVCDADDTAQIAAVEAAGVVRLAATRGSSFACKINAGYEQTTDFDWVFLTGDDVEFTPGWIAAARQLSDRYDVIGTNDSEAGRVRNPKVARGTHADHFFVRRQYVEDVGASLEGPGVLAPEAYFHFFTDVEMIQLAKARGVFAPCLDSRVIHHHPGYDGREDLRAADKTYMHAIEFSESDATAFKRRAGLIDQHKVVRKDIWR